jgi:hypothetical protein
MNTLISAAAIEAKRNAHRPVISSPDRNPAKFGGGSVDDHKADFAVPLLGRSRPRGRLTAKSLLEGAKHLL